MFPQQKANHFQNKAATENPLSQELIRNKEFSYKIHKFRKFLSARNMGEKRKTRLVHGFYFWKVTAALTEPVKSNPKALAADRLVCGF